MATLGPLQDTTGEQHGRPGLPRDRGDNTLLHSKGRRPVELPEGVAPITFTTEKLTRLIPKIVSVPHLFDDRRANVNHLSKMIMDRNTVMVEFGHEHGLLYAEGVEPNGYVLGHIIVFNRRRLPNLIEQINGSIDYLFDTFHIAHLSSWIPEFNIPALRLASNLGWTMDGILTKYGVYSGRRADLHIYSAPRES